MDERRALRCAVMCQIFESEFSTDPCISVVQSFSDEIAKGFTEEDYARANEMALGVISHKEELDAIISKYLRDWSISRLSKTDLSILRLALYELIFLDVPVKVSINEAVELSKLYSDDKSPAFINGVLGGYVNRKDA